MNNRFANCKSLNDLQKVLGNNIKFADLTDEEVERLFVVFEANKPADATPPEYPLYPLNAKSYAYVCDVVEKHVLNFVTTEIVEKVEREDFMMSIKNMKSDAFIKNAINQAGEAIADAMTDAKVRAGEDVEEFKDRCDDSITRIKDATCGVLEFLDGLTGATALKDSLYSVLYQNIQDKQSKRGFFDGAAQCRRIVADYIDGILAFDPDKDDFKTVIALRYLIGEDEDGNPIKGHRSIFTAFADGIVWICKKVTRKFRKWFGVDAESNIFGTVGASIASIFGMVAGVITAVIKVAVNVVTFVGSYIVSAVIHAISFIWNKVKGFGGFVKTKFDKKDEEEDLKDDKELASELC